MENKKSVYKLYKNIDTINLDSKSYMRPIGLGIGTALGTGMLSYSYLQGNFSNTKMISICAGMAIGFFGVGLSNLHKFKVQERKLEESKRIFDLFEREAKNILGEDINIKPKNILFSPYFEYDGDVKYDLILFKDGSCIMESFVDDDYKCYYSKLKISETEDFTNFKPEFETDGDIEITEVVDKAFQKNMKNKKQNK